MYHLASWIFLGWEREIGSLVAQSSFRVTVWLKLILRTSDLSVLGVKEYHHAWLFTFLGVLYFYVMHVWVPTYVHGHLMHAWCSGRLGEGVRTSRTVLTDSCEVHSGLGTKPSSRCS